MSNSFSVAIMLMGAIAIASSPAHARGGPPQFNSPGYQQRLQESRGYVTNRSVSQPYTTPPAAYPGKKKKHVKSH
ncbi:MAG: hypothetical protein EKK40_15610 [Bradyrhizobiaceae bacterium]|nr:MAG: hypothetical protein EKK40_15610 [Bradyrhizobiaceae bacterium]